MHGLVVIGTSAAGGELAVAAGACAAAGAGGQEAAPFVASAGGPGAGAGIDLLAAASGTDRAALAARVFDAGAPPAVAARLDGGSIEPAALLDAARAAAPDGGLLVVATGGGLLAPLAERYTNRDLARELELAMVLAVAAEPGLVSHTLLALEAAAGAGLPVAAAVVTGWPEQPARALLEERKLLETLARVPLLTLPAEAAQGVEQLADAVRDWPLEEWAAASAGAPAGASTAEGGAPPARVTLEPYVAWEERAVGDPRTTPRARIMEAMLEIVGAEGPMTATRAYSLYNRASGGRKLTTVARAPLSSSVYWLAQERKVVLVRKEEIPWQDDDVVRMPDSPAVRVRELGPRALEEVPLDEIAELVRRLAAARGGTAAATALKRAVLGEYGLVRLTARADEYLGLALDLADVG